MVCRSLDFDRQGFTENDLNRQISTKYDSNGTFSHKFSTKNFKKPEFHSKDFHANERTNERSALKIVKKFDPKVWPGKLFNTIGKRIGNDAIEIKYLL